MAEEQIEWAVDRLSAFIAACKPVFYSSPSGTVGFHGYRAAGDENFVIRESVVIEKILDKYTPDWRELSVDANRFSFRKIYECSERCLALLMDWEEVSANLRDPGPVLVAAQLHPWVWQSAQSAWEAGQFEEQWTRRPEESIRTSAERLDAGTSASPISSRRSSARGLVMKPSPAFGFPFPRKLQTGQSPPSTLASSILDRDYIQQFGTPWLMRRPATLG